MKKKLISLLFLLIIASTAAFYYLSIKPAEQAIQQSQRVKRDWENEFERAKMLSYMKEYEEAATVYQKLLRENPGHIQARRHYAQILIWMGKKEEGAEELKKTLGQNK